MYRVRRGLEVRTSRLLNKSITVVHVQLRLFIQQDFSGVDKDGTTALNDIISVKTPSHSVRLWCEHHNCKSSSIFLKQM